MAIFDNTLGIIGLYEKIPLPMTYYIDNLYVPYGVYSEEKVQKRVEWLYDKLFLKEPHLWVSSFEAAGILHGKDNVHCGQCSLEHLLQGKKILSFGSPLHGRQTWLDQLVGRTLQKVSVPLLINGVEDLLDPFILRLILEEYCEEIQEDWDLIFLAHSNLHLMKSLFQERFPHHRILSFVEVLWMDFFVQEERQRESVFYVTHRRQDFYRRAEAFLKVQQPLKVWKISRRKLER